MATHPDQLVPLAAPRPAGRTDYGFLLYVGLRTTGFLATTVLMTWGVFVLFFLVLGGFSLDGLMNHLDNMTSRYLAAGPARVDQFKVTVAIVHLIVSGALIFSRRHAILSREAARQERRA